VRAEHLERHFPGLRESDYRVTSPRSLDYNCAAWAAGDDSRWWEPGPLGLYYWPEGATREFTIDCYVEAFACLGYERCEGAESEPGFEKLALFANDQGPSHVARQLPGGRWTSKLGRLEDLEHELEGVSGAVYGDVVLFMRRPAGGAGGA
jgi:hypothetical protein